MVLSEVSSCDSDIFHVADVPTTGPHEFPTQILSQFWKKTDLIFFCRFSQNKLITSLEFKKNTEKHLKVARHYYDCRLYLFSLFKVSDAP